MKSVGIICECNPFHSGHEHLIASARAAGADVVACVMSGYFVQRGEAAILDAHTRAEALLCGGADLVLELPFPYSSGSAEFFAAAGVSMLSSLGVEELWFGSECGDIDLLSRAAEICSSEEFCKRYAEQGEGSSGTAEAYFALLQEYLGADVTCLSNDILGIAYLRAIREQGSHMRAVTIPRQGSGYSEQDVTSGMHPSATAIRRLWKQDGAEAALLHLPASVREVYRCAEEIADLKHAERAVLSHFRLASSASLDQIESLSGGLGARMATAAQRAATLEELLQLSATKKYTTARLQRGILFALTGITRADLQRAPAYARLLALNDQGGAWLAQQRKRGGIPVVTRRTDLPNTPDAKRQAELEERAYALYTLCRPTTDSAETLWKQRVVKK